MIRLGHQGQDHYPTSSLACIKNTGIQDRTDFRCCFTIIQGPQLKYFCLGGLDQTPAIWKTRQGTSYCGQIYLENNGMDHLARGPPEPANCLNQMPVGSGIGDGFVV